LGDEDPDDPAPALCPACYEKRLQRITPLLMAIVWLEIGEDGDITPAIVWLAQALEEIGGETRKYARQHANLLGHTIAIQSRQQQN
jgi:uncharacterized FlgJ-related protein